MNLRPYQTECLDRSLEHSQMGVNRQLAVLSTGLGKTAIAANLRVHHGLRNKVMFLVHMETLAVQAANAMQRWNPDLRVGVEMAGSYADLEGFYPPEFVVASVPTLGRKGSDRIKRFVPSDFGAVIQDECFPAGTMVGGIPIEQILPGMSVLSFDEVRGYTIMKRVLRVSKLIAPKSMVIVKVGDTILTCTPNHPVFTGEGWRNAENLRPSDSVLLELQGSDRHSCSISKEPAQIPHYREGALLTGMCLGDTLAGEFGAYDECESDARLESSEQNEEDACEDWASSSAGRQWTRYDGGAVDAPVLTAFRRVDTGISDSDQSRLSALLQGRYRALFAEVGDRGRWSKSSDDRKAGAGSQEGINLVWTRVDTVEIQERGDHRKPDGLCSDGYVYNLEVEDTHTYFANGVLVHNCHIGVADSFKRVYEHFGLLESNPAGPLFLGITATPNRTDGRGLRDLFDVIVFDMGIQKGIADGWLCDIRGLRVNGKAKLDNVKIRAGEFAQDELSKEVNTPSRNAIIVKEWYKHAYDRRTICFTVDIQHALDLAAAFTAHGVVAKAVWGDDPERHEKIRGHKSGEYPVICCAQLLGIGYDDPLITCIVLSAPRKSFVRYAQEVGRGTRIADGKEDLLVIDVGDNTSRHDLCSVSSLLGLPKNLDLKGESYKKAKTQLDRMAAEFPTANVQDIKSLDQLKSIAEHVSLFQVSYPPEISRLSELSWRKSVEGYILSVNRDVVTVSQDLRGDWMIRGRVGETVANLTAQNLSGAMNLADRFILDNGGVKGYLKRDAGWKTANVPPTGPQLGMCKRLHITVPTGATKGMVSAAIDAKMQQMRKPQPEYKGEF